jgi:hypothetical protein
MVCVQNNRNGYHQAPVRVKDVWNASPQLDFTLIYRGRASFAHCKRTANAQGVRGDQAALSGPNRRSAPRPAEPARLAAQCFQCSTVRLPLLVALKHEPDGEGGYVHYGHVSGEAADDAKTRTRRRRRAQSRRGCGGVQGPPAVAAAERMRRAEWGLGSGARGAWSGREVGDAMGLLCDLLRSTIVRGTIAAAGPQVAKRRP